MRGFFPSQHQYVTPPAPCVCVEPSQQPATRDSRKNAVTPQQLQPAAGWTNGFEANSHLADHDHDGSSRAHTLASPAPANTMTMNNTSTAPHCVCSLGYPDRESFDSMHICMSAIAETPHAHVHVHDQDADSRMPPSAVISRALCACTHPHARDNRLPASEDFSSNYVHLGDDSIRNAEEVQHVEEEEEEEEEVQFSSEHSTQRLLSHSAHPRDAVSPSCRNRIRTSGANDYFLSCFPASQTQCTYPTHTVHTTVCGACGHAFHTNGAYTPLPHHTCTHARFATLQPPPFARPHSHSALFSAFAPYLSAPIATTDRPTVDAAVHRGGVRSILSSAAQIAGASNSLAPSVALSPPSPSSSSSSSLSASSSSIPSLNPTTHEQPACGIANVDVNPVNGSCKLKPSRRESMREYMRRYRRRQREALSAMPEEEMLDELTRQRERVRHRVARCRQNKRVVRSKKALVGSAAEPIPVPAGQSSVSTQTACVASTSVV